jgi:hypothetical protein
MSGKIRYRNETGVVVTRRGGETVRPLGEFWTPDYEPPEIGLTIVEDFTPPIVRDTVEQTLTGTPVRVDIPSPRLHPYLIEALVRSASEGTTINLGFNRVGDETATIDDDVAYNECVDTRRVYCLWLSGTGTARVIFKEVLH